MTIVYPVLALLSVAVLLNFAITASLVRRLRQQAPPLPEPARTSLPIPEFSAVAADGQIITEADLAIQDQAVVAFFSSSCSSCSAHAPEFARLATTLRPGQAIAVVGGLRAESEQLAASLIGPVAVILEDDLGPVSAAFGMTRWPSYLKLESGKIVATAHSVKQLRLAVAV